MSRRVAADLAATPLPLSRARRGLVRADTGYDTVSGADPRAVLAGTPRRWRSIYREPLDRYARLVAGRFPRLATLSRRPAARASSGLIRPPLGGTSRSR